MNNAPEAHPHGAERLCDDGDRVYAHALQKGRITRQEAEEAWCLVELALLHPDPVDMQWLLPTPPRVAMSRLLHGIQEDFAATHGRVTALAATFERFAGLDVRTGVSDEGLRVLDGRTRIEAAIDEATAACGTRMWAVQPDGIRREKILLKALPLAQEMARKQVQMRTLYTHVARHGPALAAYLDKLGGAVEVRTLDECIERLLLFDDAVAFIPVTADRSVALEVRHPALINYLAIVFDRLWRLAVPFAEPVPALGGGEGITHRERVIAALLAEGHTDAVIAQRLGLNVRTCRYHIAKLAAALGSSSRAQLGVRIAQAGMLDFPEPLRADGESRP
ncbi:LuxR C-terminal-related transcriptional regulator [Streptomyces sp. NPDC058572]|uniref:LuxR C-terminal-related transcriptional regulator n=1 Tax=Streptomyces sp. NPDC058572 TaxID=3346546 RepID=UPI003666425B